MARILCVLLLLVGGEVYGKILISTLSQVKNHVITTRERGIHELFSQAMAGEFQNFSSENVEEQMVREWLLYFEASTFYNNKVEKGQVTSQVEKLAELLSGKASWTRLSVTRGELVEKVTDSKSIIVIYQT